MVFFTFQGGFQIFPLPHHTTPHSSLSQSLAYYFTEKIKPKETISVIPMEKSKNQLVYSDFYCLIIFNKNKKVNSLINNPYSSSETDTVVHLPEYQAFLH